MLVDSTGNKKRERDTGRLVFNDETFNNQENDGDKCSDAISSLGPLKLAASLHPPLFLSANV